MAEQRRHIWLLLAAVLTFAALLLAPAGARAQTEDGVTVDPNSPSGKEYDIPTERARREAGGKKKSDDKDPPLFGEGVGKSPTATPTATPTIAPVTTATTTPDAEKRKTAAERRARARAKKRKAQREAEQRGKTVAAAAATPTPSPPPPAAAAERVGAPDSSNSSSWALIGVMAVTLAAIGTSGGLLLRRRFGSS